jgi:hypothetical protein
VEVATGVEIVGFGEGAVVTRIFEVITDAGDVEAFMTDRRQWLYDHKSVVIGVCNKHDTVLSISQRDAKLRMVGWHQQLRKGFEIL